MSAAVNQSSAASVVEEVIQHHGENLSNVDLYAARKAEEASLRRNEAARWLRKTVGVVVGRDLPSEPSEEYFRLGLRSGIILCTVLNKVRPGSVQKIVEAPPDSATPDGAALSAYQYFENIRNFLVVVEEMGLPTFEASDLAQGGKASRVVNCVLALKSYCEWKQAGGNGSWKLQASGSGSWKFSGNVKPTSCGKQFVLRNSEPFMNSFSRSASIVEKALASGDLGCDNTETEELGSLHMLVSKLLSDKKPEDIPLVVGNLLSKVMEEFEQRLSSQNEEMNTATQDISVPASSVVGCSPIDIKIKTASQDMSVAVSSPVEIPPSVIKMDTASQDMSAPASQDISLPASQEMSVPASQDMSVPTFCPLELPPRETKIEDEATSTPIDEETFHHGEINDSGSDRQAEKQQILVKQQQQNIQDLKCNLHATKKELQNLQIEYHEEVDNLGKHLRSLAHAASGYQKVLEENRKLYNLVQDLKGSIRVYCRVRPFLPGQPSRFSTVDHVEEGSITIISPSKNGKEGKKTFTFNRCFGSSAAQEEVFVDTQPLIRSVLDGYNVCIFAYGQTGSGKTYTMSGPDELTKETEGVNYRALGDLFLISEQRKNMMAYEVSVQMIEIYNEQVRDLLATDGLNRKLEIRNNSQKGLNVPDANIVPVSSTPDVINLMNLGQKNRAVGATAMNTRSSRSHSCLTVHVQGRDLTSGTILRGCLHLVDLAGSERADKTEAVGDRLKEAQHINKSLSALGDVISALGNKSSHVPYRNSKLTQLLQDSLGGQAKTLMFVHISPEADAIGETLSTLKFAERVSAVELGAARANKDGSDVKELKEQIASLKAALAKKEGANSISSSPERGIPSYGSSPSHSSLGDTQIYDQGQLTVDVGNNREVRKSSAVYDRRRSLDPNVFQMNSPTWQPDCSSPGSNGYEKDAVSGEWGDNAMVSKKNGFSRGYSFSRLDERIRQSPEMLYEKHSPDSSKVYTEQNIGKHLPFKKESQDYDTVPVDDSDLDAATSDCSSEHDSLCQLSIPKLSSIPNGVASKLKRPSPRQIKSPELRSSIPQPSRRLSTGMVYSSALKPGRQAPPSADGKRRTPSGK
ncbi:PREDICTED: kinesin-like protein KIN-14I [Ipomoea nil]|uniref:kinesin-like protein KIN-14I n=1 Tax=Ipomoea nil TaxID=35883 RepID=UPI00090161A7|nr:PREDICTED: kinesin-like protein KIN-14I [Ipomoea nil]